MAEIAAGGEASGAAMRPAMHVLELRLGNENQNLNYVSICDDDNALYGSITSSLLSLEQLEHIDLSRNCLVEYGENIPSFLGSMKNLRYLNLSSIRSFGEVPPQLGNLCCSTLILPLKNFVTRYTQRT